MIMGQQQYITKEEHSKCRKIMGAFKELFKTEGSIMIDMGKYRFAKMENLNYFYYNLCRQLKGSGMEIFMKKILAIFLISICTLTGCGSDRIANLIVSSETSDNTDVDQLETAIETEIEYVFPGNYTVPDGWVESEQYSTAEKPFYVEDGRENEDLPDNISIEVGTNQYSAEEHESFRDAIVNQLMRQLSDSDAELLGDGTYTEQDYIVYIFTITESDGVTTKQYYIVDDYRYCLIHLTNYSGAENSYNAAQTMVDSFVWSDME